MREIIDKQKPNQSGLKVYKIKYFATVGKHVITNHEGSLLSFMLDE